MNVSKWTTASLLVPASVLASPLALSGKVVKTISKVPVHSEATVSAPPATAATRLILTGAGERVKTVLVVRVHAYVIASYAEKKITDPAAPMTSLEGSKVKAFHLTFLRDIGGGKIKGAFEESLEKNGVNLNSPALKKLLAGCDVDVKQGDTLDIIGITRADGTDEIVLQFPNKRVSAEGKGLAADFWKIYYGEPADGGLKELKKQLLGEAGN